MSALHKQPFPSFRASRIAWLEGEIRRLHARLLTVVPPLDQGADARLLETWQRVGNDALDLRDMCSELAGLQCAADGSRTQAGQT